MTMAPRLLEEGVSLHPLRAPSGYEIRFRGRSNPVALRAYMAEQLLGDFGLFAFHSFTVRGRPLTRSVR